ncbi:Lsr2 family protein [Actinomadura kijaniata]|uniref:Lsr2 family protein n=1 Tax=Actinomadura kijaniata TaxID=46161 RepID=UPI00082E9E45|nr:Lsr2 family protein [Actinomadura kijaniata]
MQVKERYAAATGETREQVIALETVRAWAESHDIKINEYDRIPGRLVAEYEAAHQTEQRE